MAAAEFSSSALRPTSSSTKRLQSRKLTSLSEYDGLTAARKCRTERCRRARLSTVRTDDLENVGLSWKAESKCLLRKG